MSKFFLSFCAAAVVALGVLGAGSAVEASGYKGRVVKMRGLSTLYYVASDNRRYVFPNEKIYNSWFTDFSDISELSESEIVSMPLGGNVLYRPGVVLVKITTDPRVYAVDGNGVLHWVKTEAIAKALYGNDWNLLIDDVPDSFFTNYTIGSIIESLNDYDVDAVILNFITIDSSRGLAIGNGRQARTGKCRINWSGSWHSRNCAATTTNNNNNSNSGSPYITAIKVENGGDNDYIDEGDRILVYFSEAIDPESVNSGLEAGDDVANVLYSRTGGVSVSSTGKVTVTNIAIFDMGEVDEAGNFSVDLDLNSTAKTLTVTLADGAALGIDSELFARASQIGGTIEDEAGYEMAGNSLSVLPTGTFGGGTANGIGPDISSIKVNNGGDQGYIDAGDSIVITFDSAIDPESVNDDLEDGNYVSGIDYNETGGVSVSGSGILTIRNIASFDVGSVELSGDFTVKLSLSSSGRILTINLTGGDEVEINAEEFDNAKQIGGTVEDEDGNEMESDSSIADPTGTFGGANDDEGPTIAAIKVSDNGDEGYIDVGDVIRITFSEAINPDSININLDKGGDINGIYYTSTGGVSVSDAGRVTIKGIAVFDMGQVEEGGNFTVKLALNSSGTVLTVTLTGGPSLAIENEDFSDPGQVGGTIKDDDGNEMEDDDNIGGLSGTFGGQIREGLYISSITVSNGGQAGYVDPGDNIRITFSEAINPHSVNAELEKGGQVSGVLFEENGGTGLNSSGILTIRGITLFDIGDVAGSANFPVKLALNSTGKILTVTLAGSSQVRINDELLGDAEQTGGTVKSGSGTTIAADASIDDPTGSFSSTGSLDTSRPYISSIKVYNDGADDYLDTGDRIVITFSEAIEPTSVNAGLETGASVSGVDYDETGGVILEDNGILTVTDIASFDIGDVAAAENYDTKLTLSSTGRILTITLTDGNDVEIEDEDLQDAEQIGGTIEDLGGNEMEDDYSLSDPTGTFAS